MSAGIAQGSWKGEATGFVILAKQSKQPESKTKSNNSFGMKIVSI